MPARAGKPAYANDRGSARSKDPASEAEIYARLLPGLKCYYASAWVARLPFTI